MTHNNLPLQAALTRWCQRRASGTATKRSPNLTACWAARYSTTGRGPALGLSARRWSRGGGLGRTVVAHGHPRSHTSEPRKLLTRSSAPYRLTRLING